MRPLTSGERRILENRLMRQYGVEEAFKDLILVMAGQKRIRACTREAYEFSKKLRKVQQLGIYVAKLRGEDVVLSIEGSQLLGDKIKVNVIDLDEDEAIEWMKASPIRIKGEPTGKYVVARHGKIYLGSGIVSRDGKIYPQVAKWRRIPEL